MRSKGRPGDPLHWRMDVPWPEDHQPLLSLLSPEELHGATERLRRLGLGVGEGSRSSLEGALKQPDALARLMDPAQGSVTLALALVAQHPGGMDADHLNFEMALLLGDDRRRADEAVHALGQHGAVVVRQERRGPRYRVLPPLRPALAPFASPWVEALERHGGAPHAGEALAAPLRTSPGHALGLLLAVLGATHPRLKSSAYACELHAKDQARVHDALLPVAERVATQGLLWLCVQADLVRPVGTRLHPSAEGRARLQDAARLWRQALLASVSPRAFGAVLRLVRAPEPGFVPESTLRRCIKELRHTEQILGAHPFPTDARGNEAGARSDLEALRTHPLLEPGRSPEGVPVLRLHPAVAHALRGGTPATLPDGHVGADHEVMVGPDAPLHALATLGMFCQPVALDRVSRFRITLESVSAAAARGVRPEEMEAALAAVAARGVPDNVKRTLADYGSPRGRAVLARGLVVAFADEADARKAAADPALAALLGEKVGLGAFLVDAAQERPVRARLVELGLAVGEETLAHTGGTRAPTDLEEDEESEAAWGARLATARHAAREKALEETLRAGPDGAGPAVGSAVLNALTRALPAVAPGAVQPLKPRKPAVPPVGSVESELFERARRERLALRLRYEPEAGGGLETMTVEVLESFERGGTLMVRVRFPLNDKAPERVLRLARVRHAEPTRLDDSA